MMKVIIGFCGAMGVFFGLLFSVVMGIVEGEPPSVLLGIGAGFFFAVVLAIYVIINKKITDKYYSEYRSANIAEPVILEDSLLRLNGNKKDAGRLFLTKESLTAVMLKKFIVLTEIKIPLDTIAGMEKRHDYGHLANILIIQRDGTETRFISGHDKLYDHLSVFMKAREQAVNDSQE